MELNTDAAKRKSFRCAGDPRIEERCKSDAMRESLDELKQEEQTLLNDPTDEADWTGQEREETQDA